MNKRVLCVLASLLASACISRADGEKLSTLKVGQDTFSNVTIISVTPTDIYFSHSQGMGNAKLKKLDPALQKKFHFDPDRAAEKEKQQADDKTLYAQVVEKEKLAPPVRPPVPVDEVQGLPGLPDEVEPHPIAAKSFINQRAPAILAEKWLNAPSSMTGKFILLEFWATSSDPCKLAIPKLNTLAADFKDRLVVIGLTDEPEEVVQKMKEPKIGYPVAIDTQHRGLIAFGVERIPHLVLVDPKGVVRFEGLPNFLDERKLEKLLDAVR